MDNDADSAAIRGRITFFSRSACRDCTAVRSFLRSKSLPYAEINLDVYPSRRKELLSLTGAAAVTVPQVFFNEKLVGGLDAVNALRSSGRFDEVVRELAGGPCPASLAPARPVYGLDDVGDEDENEEEAVGSGGGGRKEDEMAAVARVARLRVPIRDRWVGMATFVRNCFSGADLVTAVSRHLNYTREKAVQQCRKLAQKHFIHHVFREDEFEDKQNQFYHFLEHDPVIPKCYNFRGYTNDNEPNSATRTGLRLTKLMIAILEAYASDDRRHLNYASIAASEEFRRYVNLTQDLQRVDVFALSGDQKLAFFMNLYNAMVIHAITNIGQTELLDVKAVLYSDFHYMVGGFPYSLSSIKYGILLSNRRQPYTISRPFGAGDRRLELVLQKVNPLIHFGLCDGTHSSPVVQFFTSNGVEAEMRHATREFFKSGAVDVDLEKRTVYLTSIIKWSSNDFGEDILKWILDYLESSKAGLLMHLLNDGGPVKIVYQDYDYSIKS